MPLRWVRGWAADMIDDLHANEPTFLPMALDRPDVFEQLDRLSATMDEAGEDPETARALVERLRELAIQRNKPIAQQIVEWARAAYENPDRQPLAHQDLSLPLEHRLRQWNTGFQTVDEKTHGGYGLTVFGGAPKLGKSIAALAAAIDASQNGWRVVYVNAELSDSGVYARVRRYMAVLMNDPNAEARLAFDLKMYNAAPGCTPMDIIEAIQSHVGLETDRVLVVLDSINRLAENDGAVVGQQAYFDSLRRWNEWARLASRDSEGRLSFLVVSELNRKGEIKGASLEYGADMVMRFQPDPEERGNALVEVSMSRDTVSTEPRAYTRVWNESRFVVDYKQ